MEIRKLLCEELRLPWHYVSAYEENRAVVLVHDNWIQTVVQAKTLPAEFIRHPSLSNEEIRFLLQQLQGDVEKGWKKLEIYRISKKLAVSRKLPRVQKIDSRSSDLTYFQLLHYVSETNYMNRWKETLRTNAKKYKRFNITEKHDTYNNVIREALRRLNDCPFIDVRTKNEVDRSSRLDSEGIQSHLNSLPAVCVFESNSTFYVFYPYFKHTVNDCVKFSPAIFSNSTIKPLFIIYQLLQATRHFHDSGLCLGDIGLNDIRVDSNLWIYVEPKILEGVVIDEDSSIKDSKSNTTTENLVRDNVDQRNFNDQCVKNDENKKGCSPNEKILNLPLLDIVSLWTKGEISNFDYLMALNHIAGRKMGNPNYHPVLPWIMDFTVANGGWRDLSKSKFRLNKGDRQLELTYETIPMNIASLCNSVGGEPVQVPHHVSDFLSEITYYVYKARQTPKSVLCHYVRSKWVPAEYPSSMRRLYEWTPDECIPEFFYDADIFRSVHRDLPDLEIPWWANSAEDFVAKHREALESQHVTERLHHWIDLTFGYKLSGSAAIKAKNVCYHLVDKHTNLTVGGIIQLFTHPHPHHSSFSLYLTRRPTCLQYWKPIKKIASESSPEHSITQSVNKDGNEEETDSTKLMERKRSIHTRSKILESKSAEHPMIVLPKDYIPLARLNQLESICTFSLKATLKVPENQQQVNNEITNSHHQRHIRDMIVIGCLIVELFLANKLKTMRPKATLEERYQLICSVLLTDTYELPRCVKHCVQLLLQLKKIDRIKNAEIPKKMPVITDDGLPPPSAHQLLQPLIHIIPFPTYFQKLYLILCQLKSDMAYLEMELTSIHSNTTPENLKITENVVKLMQNEFQDLLPQLNEDGLKLTIPYIKELFVSSHTTVMASWYLFGIVSQAIGPRQTFHTLIEPVVKLFDVEYPTAKHMKLFHRSYLLQLIVRLGLQTFLSCFSTLLIEAVGGFKDFSLKTSMNLNSSEFTRHSSHLRSTEFEELRFTNDSKATVGLIFSPFEENSSHQEISSPFTNKSELDDGSVTTVSEDQIGPEPEIFVFDNEDFNGGTPEKTELTNLETLEEIRGESLSDSTSVDGLPMNEMTSDVELASQSNIEADQDALRSTLAIDIKRPRSSCSFSEGFPVIAGKSKQLIDSESYSSSVPNLASVALPQCSTVLSSAVEVAEPSTKSFKANVEFNISDVATETVIWLSHRLGPVLTAKYLSRNLLRMLSLCYLGSEQLEYVNDIQESAPNQNVNNIIISPREVVGDGNASKVVRCLMSITSLYGVHFILLQYIPHMIEIVTQAKRRVTSSYEAGLIGNLVLIHHIVPCLSDAILMDHLQDTLIKEILHPTIRLISSSLQFPNGGHARQVIAFKFLDALYIIGLRIGFEMTRKHLTRIIQHFFSIFSKVHYKIDSENKLENEDIDRINSSANAGLGSSMPPENESSNNQVMLIKEELYRAFTPELAYFGYILFCKLAGGIYADQNLPNEELIHQLCLKHDNALSSWSLNNERSLKDEQSQILNLDRGAECKEKREVTVVGNRIDIKIDDDEESPGLAEPNGIKKIFNFSKYDFTKLTNKMENESRHLKGNWLAYWEHELGRNEKDNRFNFKQIKLQTFVGHTNSVRNIYVLDNENSFISASKDKTVKLWSLRSHGDGSAVSNCQWTYNNHKKSVFSVTFLDSLRLAASCDSTVHVWDPFMGACLKAFDSNKNSPSTVLLAMPPPSTVLISATTESSIRFLDVRTLKYMHEFKVNLGPAGLIRSLAVSPNSQWVAVGYSSGIISILDVRTGLLSSTWKGHEGEILQVKAYNDHSFVTSSLDQCVSVWNADDGKLKCHLRGPTEPVHCLSFYKNEMISGTTANRIGVHTSIDSQASFSSTRLQSDTFKGVLTSMAVLPQNRVMLLGADNGYIRLLC